MSNLATISQISSHLSSLNLDIRVTNNGRWIDQKCTPDVLCAMAESVIDHRKKTPTKEFTSGTNTNETLWKNKRFKRLMEFSFSKPSVHNVSAKNEYDKVISQSLLLFCNAGLLTMRKEGNLNYYKINTNSSLAFPILSFIAHRDSNSLIFLNLYLKAVLSASGLMPIFSNFLRISSRKKPSKAEFEIVKDAFEKFTNNNTKIKGKFEPRRIFTKVINPLAFEVKAFGTRKGRLSATKITFQELLYSSINFRDLLKDKTITRQEYQKQISNTPSLQFSVQKAKSKVRDRHKSSEVLDGSESTTKTEIHHIFMEHERPSISAHLENLINLTSNQHRNKAHPKNFDHVDNEFQKICIFSKIDSIELSIKHGDGFYDKDKFIEVLNIGFDENLFNVSYSFNEIRKKINSYYYEKFGI